MFRSLPPLRLGALYVCESYTSLQIHLAVSILPISVHFLPPSLPHFPFSFLSLPSLSFLISSSLIRGSPSTPQCTPIGQCVVHHHGNLYTHVQVHTHVQLCLQNAIKLPPPLSLSSFVFLLPSVLVLTLIVIRTEGVRVRSLTGL